MTSQFKLRRGRSAKEIKELLAESLQSAWGGYLEDRARFLKKQSSASVHSLRRAIRKLEAALELLHHLHPLKGDRKLLRRISSELKILSDLRDIQVQKKNLRCTSPAWIKQEKLLNYLESLEKSQRRRSFHKIRAFREGEAEELFAQIKGRQFRYLDDLSPKEQKDLLTELTSYLEYRKSHIEFKSLALLPEKGKPFHKLRVETKSLANQLEMMSSVLKPPRGFERKLLKSKEDLGQLQDQVALRRKLKGFYQKSKSHPHPKKEFKKEILKKRRSLVLEAYR